MVFSGRSIRIKGSEQEDIEGNEESKGGLDRYSVQGVRNLSEQKQQQESIPAREGSNLRETVYRVANPRDFLMLVTDFSGFSVCFTYA